MVAVRSKTDAMVFIDWGDVAERPELRHAGPNDVNREAELDRPSRVACSDLKLIKALVEWFIILGNGRGSVVALPRDLTLTRCLTAPN